MRPRLGDAVSRTGSAPKCLALRLRPPDGTGVGRSGRSRTRRLGVQAPGGRTRINTAPNSRSANSTMPPGWMTTVGSTREAGWRRRWVRRNLGRERVAGEGSGARMSPILVHFHCRGSSPEGSLRLAYSGAGKEDGLPPKHDFRRAEQRGDRSTAHRLVRRPLRSVPQGAGLAKHPGGADGGWLAMTSEGPDDVRPATAGRRTLPAVSQTDRIMGAAGSRPWPPRGR